MRNPDRNSALREKRQWDVKKLERFLNREYKGAVPQAMYPLLDEGCPVQLGALGEPFDEVELHTRWCMEAIPLFIKYKIPVKISTKGARVLQRPEYLRLFEDSPDQFWFAFSISCNDDELISKIDIKAPPTSERLKAMKALTDLGCKAILRFRPFLPGVSDSYPGEPNAWEVLIERSHAAGARAISFEWIFLYNRLTTKQKEQYKDMFSTMRNPNFGKEWGAMSDGKSACKRANRNFKYDMTMQIREKVHSLGWSFGISDPHFKEWNDSGSCCGFPDTGDKWFSNWSRRQLTEVIVQGKKAFDAGKPRLFSYDDWRPEWAHQIKKADCVSLGDCHTHRRFRDQTFGDTFRNKWNNGKHPRGPNIYFDGDVMSAVGKDLNSGDLVYEYRP
jgi:DNA repair photolyase